MIPLLGREAVRALDAEAIGKGVSGLVLMENAGRGAYEAIAERFAGRLGGSAPDVDVTAATSSAEKMYIGPGAIIFASWGSQSHGRTTRLRSRRLRRQALPLFRARGARPASRALAGRWTECKQLGSVGAEASYGQVSRASGALSSGAAPGATRRGPIARPALKF